MLRAVFAYWPALEAEAQLSRVIAASAPHTKPRTHKELLRDLQHHARDLYPRSVAQPMPKEGYDPEKAREWFESQGIKVVKSG